MSTTTASRNLSIEWQECCYKAKGFDPHEMMIDNNYNKQPPKRHYYQIINLLQDDDDEDEVVEDEKVNDDNNRSNVTDPWMKTAIQIQSNINNMSLWIQTKKSYVYVTMSDNEASLIQSTVTSFVATTANEIESLNQYLTSRHNDHRNQYKNHCNSIIQILRYRLEYNIMNIFNQYQKQRNRIAVTIWQKPLQCHLYIPMEHTITNSMNNNNKKSKTDSFDTALGLDDDDDDDTKLKTNQQFIPCRPSHRLHQDFYTSYEQEQSNRIPERPISIFTTNNKRSYNDAEPKTKTTQSSSVVSSLFRKKEKTTMPVQSIKGKGGGKLQKLSTPSKQGNAVDAVRQSYIHTDNDDDNNNRNIENNELYQESLLITSLLNNDLDNVQKMENMMINITTLLSQFAELAQEQQENVTDIYQTTIDTKDNIDKGKDQLINAKERTTSSHHYMAKGIFLCSILLLFFHWILP